MLLNKADEEYEHYSQVWDKQYGYYDEDRGVELSLDDAKKYIQSYVNGGVNSTYGIISELEVSDEEYESLKEDLKENSYFGNYLWFDMDYSTDSIVYSLTKNKENFIKKEKQ